MICTHYGLVACVRVADVDCEFGYCADHCSIHHQCRCGEYHDCICHQLQREDGTMERVDTSGAHADDATIRFLEAREPLVLAALKFSEVAWRHVYQDAPALELTNALAKVEAAVEKVWNLLSDVRKATVPTAPLDRVSA